MSILYKSLTLLLTTTLLSSAYSNDLVPIRSSSAKFINKISINKISINEISINEISINEVKNENGAITNTEQQFTNIQNGNENGAITNTEQQFTNIQNGNEKKKQIKYYNKVMETAYIDIKNDDNELIISLGQIDNIINNLLLSFDSFQEYLQSGNTDNVLRYLNKIYELKELCSKDSSNYNKYSTFFNQIIYSLNVFCCAIHKTLVSKYEKKENIEKEFFKYLYKNTRKFKEKLQNFANIIANIYGKFQINNMNYAQTNLLAQACKALSKNNDKEAKQYLEKFFNNNINNNNVNGISDIITADKIKNLLKNNTNETFGDKQINNFKNNIKFDKIVYENILKQDGKQYLINSKNNKEGVQNIDLSKLDITQKLAFRAINTQLKKITKPLNSYVNKNKIVNGHINKNTNGTKLSQTPKKINYDPINVLQNNTSKDLLSKDLLKIKQRTIKNIINGCKIKIQNTQGIKETKVNKENIIQILEKNKGTNNKEKNEGTNNKEKNEETNNKYTLSLDTQVRDKDNNTVTRNLIQHLLRSKHLVQNSVIGYSHIKNESNDKDEKTLIAGIKKLQNYKFISYIITKTYDQQEKDIKGEYKEFVYSIIENYLVAPMVYKFFNNINECNCVISKEADHYNLSALNTVGDINNIIFELEIKDNDIVEVSFITMFGKTENGYKDRLTINKDKSIQAIKIEEEKEKVLNKMIEIKNKIGNKGKN